MRKKRRTSHLSRPITQLTHLLFVTRKLSIEFLDLDFDSRRASIRLRADEHNWGPLWESHTHLIDDVLQCWLWFLAGRRRAEYPVHGVDLKVTGRRPVPKVWTTVLYGIEILRWHYAHLSHLTAQQLQPIWIFSLTQIRHLPFNSPRMRSMFDFCYFHGGCLRSTYLILSQAGGQRATWQARSKNFKKNLANIELVGFYRFSVALRSDPFSFMRLMLSVQCSLSPYCD